MCLARVYRGKERKEALAKLKDVITVWKVLLPPDEEMDYYYTDCRSWPVYAGEVKFKQNVINKDGSFAWGPKYRGGGHFWLTREAAIEWKEMDCYMSGNKDTEIYKHVRCTVRKEDINAIGEQGGHVVVVVKKATFPKYVGEKKEVK